MIYLCVVLDSPVFCLTLKEEIWNLFYRKHYFKIGRIHFHSTSMWQSIWRKWHSFYAANMQNKLFARHRSRLFVQNPYLIQLCCIFASRLASSFCHHISTVLGLKWELRGKEHLEKEQSCIIVSNHQSSLDILGNYLALRLLCCMNTFDSIGQKK